MDLRASTLGVVSLPSCRLCRDTAATLTYAANSRTTKTTGRLSLHTDTDGYLYPARRSQECLVAGCLGGAGAWTRTPWCKIRDRPASSACIIGRRCVPYTDQGSRGLGTFSYENALGIWAGAGRLRVHMKPITPFLPVLAFPANEVLRTFWPMRALLVDAPTPEGAAKPGFFASPETIVQMELHDPRTLLEAIPVEMGYDPDKLASGRGAEVRGPGEGVARRPGRREAETKGRGLTVSRPRVMKGEPLGEPSLHARPSREGHVGTRCGDKVTNLLIG